MKNLKNKTALITGASSGIGKAIAYELAKQDSNLLITARSEDKLKEIAFDLASKYDIKVNIFVADLSIENAPEKLFEFAQNEKITVDILVNNAGFGKWTNFLNESIETYQNMLNLNINSLVKLTYLFLPEMLKKQEGGIINIASTGALQPCPYVAVYCASKSFVLNFSEALHGEFYKKGITITAICPGNTITGFQNAANANIKGMSYDTPEKVAQDSIKAFQKRKNNKIIGTSNYLQSFIPRFFPRKIVINIVENLMNKKVNFS